MELLPGLSLAELVERHGPLPPERAVHFLTQVCDALREAHGLGLIHRDVKPANVFAAHRGGIDDVAKLLDFGLVISRDEKDPDGEAGAFSGSPRYVSPEQARGDPLDARSDLYSLGAVGYFLLTAQTVFAGKDPVAHVMGHLYEPVVPPSRRHPGVP